MDFGDDQGHIIVTFFFIRPAYDVFEYDFLDFLCRFGAISQYKLDEAFLAELLAVLVYAFGDTVRLRHEQVAVGQPDGLLLVLGIGEDAYDRSTCHEAPESLSVEAEWRVMACIAVGQGR